MTRVVSGAVSDVGCVRDNNEDSYLVKPISRNALKAIVGLLTNIDRAGARELSKT